MERTHRWAERALTAKSAYHSQQTLFGIVQGAFEPELRQQSARFIGSLPFPGLSIGGLSVGEPKQVMWDLLKYVTPELPRGKPRHLLGVGSPEDLVIGVGLGMDMFDCVLPTRVARHGGLFTKFGRVSIKSARYRSPKRSQSKKAAIAIHAGITVQHMYTTWRVLKSNSTIAWGRFTIYVLCYAWLGNCEKRLSQEPIQPFATTS